jgi:alkylhydroperoxidase family enzyme
LAVQLAEALTYTPARVDDQLYQQLEQAFSHKELVDLAFAISWKNSLSRFNRLYQIDEAAFPAP